MSVTNGIDYENVTQIEADAESSLRIDRHPHVPLVRAISENYGDCRLRLVYDLAGGTGAP